MKLISPTFQQLPIEVLPGAVANQGENLKLAGFSD
jgi:hypothetical protein